MLELHQIHAARERIREAIYLSPCARSELLSERSGCDLFLKLENLQMSGSFKERGACNRLELLGARERAAGVVAASAGNHAQGLAWHARRLGMECVVVMPVGTPLVKQVATQRFGAEVRLEGRDYDEACVCARRLEQERGLTFIHAFDDLEVMAGQGTIGMELIEQVDRLDAVVVPVGGGGLAAGVAVAVKALRPSVEVYGVEAGAVPSMTWARREGRPCEAPARRTIADGIAVRTVGERCFELLQLHLAGLVTVDDEAIAAAVLTLLEDEKTVAEGAGATALAGVLGGHLPLRGKRVACVVSGGNIDVNLMARVIDRGLWRSGRLVRINCTLGDVPGALSGVLQVVGEQGANVLEIDHERVGDALGLGETEVALLLETRGFEHIEAIESGLGRAKIPCRRDSQLEAAGRRSLRVPAGKG